MHRSVRSGRPPGPDATQAHGIFPDPAGTG
jgi:hypothetical protein